MFCSGFCCHIFIIYKYSLKKCNLCDKAKKCVQLEFLLNGLIKDDGIPLNCTLYKKIYLKVFCISENINSTTN